MAVADRRQSGQPPANAHVNGKIFTMDVDVNGDVLVPGV